MLRALSLARVAVAAVQYKRDQHQQRRRTLRDMTRIHLTGVLCETLGEKWVDKKDKSTAVNLKAVSTSGVARNLSPGEQIRGSLGHGSPQRGPGAEPRWEVKGAKSRGRSPQKLSS